MSWDEELSGSDLLANIKSFKALQERLNAPVERTVTEEAIEAIKNNARQIANNSSDSDVQDLADYVLVLAAMVEELQKKVPGG